MTGKAKWAFGSLWVDTALPTAVGLLGALILIRDGGAIWTLLAVPALCWCVWQLAHRLETHLVIRVLLVTAVTAIILVCFFLLFGVDTAGLYQAVADAGIGVNAVSTERNAVIVSIQPVSWGPERNDALRAIFVAAHTYARSKKAVSIHWGDAMTTNVKMKDIEQFLEGHITYREMLNRIEWSGTPDVLPEDST